MALSASTVGLIVIMTLYFGIGVLSAAGSIYISKALLTPKLEQIVFALFLYAPQPMACCLGASRTVERLIGRLDCGDWFFVEVGVPEQLSIWHSGERDTLRDSRIAGK